MKESVFMRRSQIRDITWKENVGFNRSISIGVPKLGMGAGHRIFGCREGMFVVLNLSSS